MIVIVGLVILIAGRAARSRCPRRCRQPATAHSGPERGSREGSGRTRLASARSRPPAGSRA
jgi:hypothetical protein